MTQPISWSETRRTCLQMVQIDSGVATVYEDVRNDKTPTNWLILGYTDDKGEVLKTVATGNHISQGTGGLEEFKKNLKEDQAYFGYIRMVVGNDELVSIANPVSSFQILVGLLVWN